MSSGYRIAILGAQTGRNEYEVAESLAPKLNHSAVQLIPILRERKTINVNLKDATLLVARGLKESFEKIGCSCALESLGQLPPKALSAVEKFESTSLRSFMNPKVGLKLDAPVNWRDDSDESYFRIGHTGTSTWFTSSLNRDPGVDLQVWAEIRFGSIPSGLPYLKSYRTPYSWDTEAGPAIVAEFRGIAPGDTEETHQLVMCLRPEVGAISLNITSSVSDYKKHEALYRWLLLTRLRLCESDVTFPSNPSHPEAQYELGVKLAKNNSHREAIEWFQKASMQGHAEAQFNLAGYFHRGEVVTQSYKQAFEWTKKSAEQGFRPAQFTLANLYGMGQGVDQDIFLAFNWLLKAAEQGDPEAQHKVSLSYISGYGVKKNIELAAQWALKAANQGHPDAQFYVGFMYEGGEGMKQDTREAISWYQKAAAQQHPMAIERLKAIDTKN